MSKVVSLADVQESKCFIHPSNEKWEFKHPMNYLEPLVTAFDGVPIEWEFKADVGSSNKDKDSEVKNTAFSRLSVIAKLPNEVAIQANDPVFKDIYSRIGLVYALDTARPEIRIFTGSEVQVCTNMCVFGSNDVKTYSLMSNYAELNDWIKKFVDNSMDKYRTHQEIVNRMSEKRLIGEQYYAKVGQIAIAGITERNLGTNVSNDVIRSFNDPQSKYYVSSENSTVWRMYNAVTEQFKHKSSVFDEPLKVQSIRKLFLDDLNLKDLNLN